MWKQNHGNRTTSWGEISQQLEKKPARASSLRKNSKNAFFGQKNVFLTNLNFSKSSNLSVLYLNTWEHKRFLNTCTLKPRWPYYPRCQISYQFFQSFLKMPRWGTLCIFSENFGKPCFDIFALWKNYKGAGDPLKCFSPKAEKPRGGRYKIETPPPPLYVF